jgi:tetratricopeptide (TPR) repeat protein
LIGLLPLALAELTLCGLGWGTPRDAGDPFVGFRSTRPLFVRNEAENVYETAVNRQAFFRPESFSLNKEPKEFRIFCLGGSTVQGRPFAIETSFTTWLELGLKAADSSRTWQVVNCGGVSYASYRLALILEEVLTYQPDLVIIYAGHNEFLEDRTYGHIKEQHAPFVFALETASRLRTFTLLRDVILRAWGPPPEPREDRPLLPEEVEARLDYQGGLEQYQRDLQWRKDVLKHFRFNLRRMVSLGREADVPVWLADPVCNLRDCPPFKSQHRDGLGPEQLRQWEALRRKASEFYKTDMRMATECLQQALRLDDQFAGLHYDLAKCYETLGLTAKAREAYLRAKELDVCPLRILEGMNQAIHDISRRTGATLIPVRADFCQRDRYGIPGAYLLVDHVHPSVPGHQLIAALILDQMMAQGLVHPSAGWEERRDALYRAHTESLDDWYYLEGERRLQALRAWAAGRATLARPESEK